MDKLNFRVELTHSEPEEVGQYQMINITARQNGHERAVAVVSDTDRESSLSIARHVCAIPQMVEIMELHYELINKFPKVNHEGLAELDEKVRAVYKKLYGNVSE